MYVEKRKIIAGYVNIGKSYLARLIPERYIDLDPTDYKMEYDAYFVQIHEKNNKALVKVGKTLCTNFPQNYIEKIAIELNSEKNILISCQDLNEEHMRLLKRELPDAELLLAYPNIKLKSMYLDSLRKRGISTDYIHRINHSWDKDILNCLKNKTVDNHIILGEKEYLWDGLNRFYKQNKCLERVRKYE